ncbi:DUF6443 domain-containing protein [Flagellimonas sp. DF-77]|uniref:DUF6443 domain-containing protein n=1 Tax=Flagellimonas algarum TaxID=3230298 RepID=UPI0033949735
MRKTSINIPQFITFVLFLSMALSAKAQFSILGDGSVNVNVNENYTVSNSSGLLGNTWSVAGTGMTYTIVSGQGTPNVTIRFTSVGNAIVNYNGFNPSTNNAVIISKPVTVSGTVVGPVTITSGPTGRCQGGGTSDYNASASNATSYTWSLSNAGSSTINSSTGLVTWSSSFSGTARVNVTANGPNNSSSSTFRNVVVEPAISTGSLALNSSPNGTTTICSGLPVTLSLDFGQSNVTYELLRNNVVVQSVTGSNTAVTFSPVSSSGTYRVRASKNLSQCPDVLGPTLTLSSLPDVGSFSITGGTSSRCQGSGTSDFNASASNATSYSWSIANAGGSTINQSTGVVTWNSGFSGTATISVTASNSCDSRTVNRNVTVSAPPITSYTLSGTNALCSGTSGSITLSDSQSGVDYELRRGATSIATLPGTGGALTWTNSTITSGTYSVVASNGVCSDVTLTSQWTIGTTSAGSIGISASTGAFTDLCPGQIQLFPQNTNTVLSWEGVDSWNQTNALVTIAAGQSITVTLNATTANCNVSQSESVTLTAKAAPSGATITSGLQAVCQGTSSTDYNASASNFDTEEWTLTPAGAGSINQNGTVQWNAGYTGQATVTYRAISDCNVSDTATRTVTVSAPPNASYTLSGTNALCSGNSGSITLSDSQSGVDYELRRGATSIATLPGTGGALTWTNSTITAGTYSVVASNGVCADVTLTSQWTIGSQSSDPIAISSSAGGFMDICPGQVQLFPVNTNSVQNWTGVDSFTSTNALVTIAAGQSITVTLFATDNCNVSQQTSVTLTGSTGPSATSIDSGDTQICQGTASSTYTGSATNATTFSWDLSPSAAGTIDSNGTVSWNSSYVGQATVIYEARNNCNQTDTATVTVDVTNTLTYYEDKDRDGFYINTVQSCTNPDTAIYVTQAEVTAFGDCDDNDNSVGEPLTWYIDADGDNYPLADSFVTSCVNPGIALGNPDDYAFGPYVSTDCDDTDPLVTITRWYRDVDEDGLGDPFDTSLLQCDQPTLDGPWVDNNNDFCPNDDQNTCGNVPVSTDFGPNYIYKRTYQTERSGSATNFFTQDAELIQSVTYFDDLGRPVQQINLEQAPEINGSKQDIVTHMVYDGFGRMAQEWLPVPLDAGASFGATKAGVESSINNHYNTAKYENTTNPYSLKAFDNSPLDRVEKQAAAGNDWAMGSDHEMEFDYETNETTEVRFFEVEFPGGNTESPELNLNPTEYYPAGRLFKTITFTEDHVGPSKDYSTEEFIDTQGRTILRRSYEGGAAHETYYVYDDFGNLTFVLPPKMDATTATLNDLQSGMADLGYRYVYDYRNRMVEKQLPGKNKEYVVYNKLDQPIMTQDANQRAIGEWLFTKYDAFGRVAYTGKHTDTADRSTVQANADAIAQHWVSRGSYSVDAMEVGYTNGAYPTSNIDEILMINYYDDYTFDLAGTTNAHLAFDVMTISDVNGLATGTKVKVLTTNTWITTATFYDEKARPIYTYSRNDYLNTTDIVVTKLDYVGRPLKVRSAHTRGSTNVVTLDNFTYDHVGRLLSQTQCIGDDSLGESCDGVVDGGGAETNPIIGDPVVDTDQVAIESITLRAGPGEVVILRPSVGGSSATLRIDPNAAPGGGGTGSPATSAEELIVANSYDALGQLQSKQVGGDPNGSGLQTVDYEYNVRGWLEGINDASPYDNALTLNSDDLWGFRIKYNDIADTSKKLFNGNISETLWASKSVNPGTPGNPVSSRYTYTYDALNRIKTAIDDTGHYNVNNISYDKNGNILSLTRQGQLSENPSSSVFGVMDDLAYSYDNGNQLLAVDDQNAIGEDYGFVDRANTTIEFGYDVNGNITSDLNRGITNIEYNYLNLPMEIVVSNVDHNGTISYIYDANGTKIMKSSAGNTTLYAGSFVYSGPTGNEQLQFFGHPEGYITSEASVFDYVYQFKDQLGNIRLSYLDNDGVLEIVEEKNYYPFGLNHSGYNNGGSNSLGNDFAEKWKFQGQELTDELGLSIFEFKYRMHDPSTGRFWQVDPLSESYSYQSPYNFAENRVIDGFELEGLEWVDTENGWQYQGYDYGPQQFGPQPQGAVGVAPAGSSPVAAWVTNEPRAIPFTGTVETLNVGGPDGTVQQFQANENGVVELPSSGTEQTGPNTSGTFEIDGYTVYGYYNRNDVSGAVEDQFGTPNNVANMINSITEFNETSLIDNSTNPVQIGDMRSPTNGRTNINSTATHHGNNGAFDLRLVGANGGLPGGTTVNNSSYSAENTQLLVNALGNNGFTRFLVGPNAVNNLSNSGSITIRNGGTVHNNHYHVDVD